MSNKHFDSTERKARQSDYRFFRDLVKNSLFHYIIQYGPFNFRYLRESFRRTKEDIRILMRGKRRIGLYQLTPKGASLEITRIFLAPSYRGKGIGTWYLRHFENLGYSRLTLQVWENNPARHIYKNLGYKTIAIKDHKLHMEKLIK